MNTFSLFNILTVYHVLFYLYFLTLPVLAAAPDIALPNYYFYFSCFFLTLKFIKHLFSIYNPFIIYYLPNPVVYIFFPTLLVFDSGRFDIYTPHRLLPYYVLYVFSFQHLSSLQLQTTSIPIPGIPYLLTCYYVPPLTPYILYIGSLCNIWWLFHIVPSCYSTSIHPLYVHCVFRYEFCSCPLCFMFL